MSEVSKWIQQLTEITSEHESSPNKSSDYWLAKIDSIQTEIKHHLTDLNSYDQEKLDTRLTETRNKIRGKKQFKFKFGLPKSEPKFTSNESTTNESTTDKKTTDESNLKTEYQYESKFIYNTSTLPILKLSNLKNSVVYANIDSSFFGTNLINCRLVLNCQQCRLNNCINTEVQIYKCPNPIIETSNQITFYSPNKIQVSDFQWLKLTEPSPNFKLIINSELQPPSKQTLEEEYNEINK